MQVDTNQSRGAWIRSEDNTYGAGKYPFGKCSECSAPACHKVPGNNGSRLVCMAHKPAHIVFVPFLGQQTKIFSATERWVLAGGGAGGSKTYGGSRLWLKQYFSEETRYQAAKKKGLEFSSRGWAIFFRRTMPELLQVIEDFKKYYKKVDPEAKWNEQQKLCIFTNGYKVQFGGMEDDTGYLRYYGGEYTLVVIDEATQFTIKQLEEIDARIRCSDPILDRRCQMYYLTNPVGGATKQYLRDEFVRKAPPETPLPRSAELADGRVITEHQVYIPSNLYDNPALIASGKYEASLKKRSQAMKRALLDNDWEGGEGTWVGTDWDPSLHVVRPHVIPKSWPKMKMADWGMSARASVLWAAIDPNGAMVVYRAWSCRNLNARQFCARIREIESQPLFWKDPSTGRRVTITEPEWDMRTDSSTVFGPMDDHCWAREGHELTIGQIFDEAGVGFTKSAKAKEAAADQIRTRLQTLHPDHHGKLTQSGLRFFADLTVTKIQRNDGREVETGPIITIPALPFDEKNPDLWDTKADDHDMDALAYGVMERPTAAEEAAPELLDYMVIRRPSSNSSEKIPW